ncbi:conserved exported hypothetical protein [uncultured delta proteobacterium]|uniref:Uncharacterized protein n=1 Tax=uncultured delta proteobacterium TaxID=34034 RepID=A0A212IWP0_9DELT|nr:conserved exported hypothetical protein [uncultured delta proteobacterium]
MNTLHVPARLAMLTMLMLIVFLAGCTRSSIPVPEQPVAYSQEKAQASDHWRDIAVDIADKIRDALVERSDLTTKPLYVMPPNSRPFTTTFHQVVKSELVSRAIQVSEQREPDSVQVEYDVVTVKFDPSRRSAFSSASDHEVVINVRMAYDGRYVVHRSYIRYINDCDWMQYLSPETLDPSAGKSRVVRVTNR